MTKEKEKAQELVAKFAGIETDIAFMNSDDEFKIESHYLTHKAAKQAAHIAVEEVIKNYQTIEHFENYHTDLNYWDSVKTEIINL